MAWKDKNYAREYFRVKQAEYRLRYPERYRVSWKKWYEKNKRYRSVNARQVEHYRARYGMSIEQVEALGDKQLWLCAGCSCPLEKTGPMKFGVDHNHKTGAVRGLLCRLCNLAIGYMKDDPSICRRIAEYLERKIS